MEAEVKPVQNVEQTDKNILTVFNRAQQSVRQQLMRGAALEAVLDSLILMIQEVSPDMKGSILLLHNSGRTLHHASAPSLDKAYSEVVDGLKVGATSGSCGTAAYLGKLVIVEDIEHDKLWENFQFALEFGLKACWSHPIMSSTDGGVLGTFAMYYTSVRRPTQTEVELLEISAGLAGTAIEWNRILHERKSFEDELRNSNAELLQLNKELDERVKRRTAELEYQNYLNRIITDNATGALFMMNEFGECTFMNPAAVAMTGFTLEELANKPLHDIIHHTRPDGSHYPLHECPIDRALPQNSDVRAHQDVFIRKDGTFFPVSCAASPIKENGVPVGTVIEVRDVTEEKKAEQELLESAEKLRLILEAMPQIAWTANPGGDIDYINRRWEEYTGKIAVEGIGDLWLKAVHEDDRDAAFKVWKASLESGADYENYFKIKAKDGTYRWFLARAVPLVTQDGELLKWFGTCTDVHEQRLAIENLVKAQEQLTVINSELSSKNKELMKTNADLDNFVYTASHDLRAPIANLEGLLLALKDELALKEVSVTRLLEYMDVAIGRFKRTIAELTEISKTQKNIEEEEEQLDLNELLADIKESIRDTIANAGATITSDFSALDTVRFSRKNFRSILYNLISNGIKYRSLDRPVEVKVSVKYLEAEKEVLLRVEDNGLGVDMSQADQLFVMFKRLHDHVEGSGVGLYIVKRIVENAGGRIEVESELGKGSAFIVYLPAGKQL
ncbi:GAF domain-containing sensor histidine kinase [Pontibacter harenae]|uniref:GAF domain-containing sensor histidine kinase n=1 Tax=Pontibacter harenae TaxID=2894083 RepID=UPI001E523EAA|nr:PAS domain S-box protein [Pontibacter harenae]MCC9168359.1 PAS domain S-box protein [Pontibacter harenae]